MSCDVMECDVMSSHTISANIAWRVSRADGGVDRQHQYHTINVVLQMLMLRVAALCSVNKAFAPTN